MANKNPWKARRAKAEKRIKNMSAGDLQAVQAALWIVLTDGLSRLEKIPDADHADFARVANSLVSASREYRETISAGEFENRLVALEEQQRTNNQRAYA